MKKGKIKIFVGILLSVVMLFSVLTPAFAVGKRCGCGHAPVLSISGINSVPLLDADGGSVFPPSNEAIVQTVLEVAPYLSAYLLNHNVDALLDGLLPAVNKLFGGVACGPDGKPAVDGVHVEGCDPSNLFDISYANHLGTFNDALAEVIGEDHVYQYSYDWRRSPFDIADDINTAVQLIKAETGHDKVALDGQSMGACMVQAYLAVYGTKDVETVGMVSGAFTGVEMVSQLFEAILKFQPKCSTI